MSRNRNKSRQASKEVAHPTIERIPNQSRTQGIEARAVAKSWRGPIPSPDDLAAYNLIDPTFAQTLIDMAKKEQSGRIDCEKHNLENQTLAIKHESSAVKRAQWMGTAVMCLCICLAIVSAKLSMPLLLSLGLLSIPVMSGIEKIFSSHRKQNNEEKKSKE